MRKVEILTEVNTPSLRYKPLFASQALGRVSHNNSKTMNIAKTSLILWVAPRAAQWEGIAVLASPIPHRTLKTTSSLLQAKLTHPLVWTVDWLKISTGKYAVVDPHDPTHLVYLNEKEYHKLSNVIATQEETLQVIAHPFDEKPADKDILASRPKTSPTSPQHHTARFWTGMRSRLGRSYRGFLVRGANMLSPNKVTERLLIGFLTRVISLSAYFAGLKELQTLKGSVSQYITEYIGGTYRHRGLTGTVLLLKTTLLIIHQYLAGENKHSWSYPYPVATVNGLPRWLPVAARQGIRSRSHRVIRFWSTVLYTYKVITMPYKVTKSVQSIISAPFSLSSASTGLLDNYRNFLRHVYVPYLGGVRKLPQDEPGKFFAPCSAGPNGTPAVNFVGSDALAWQHEMKREGKGFKHPLLRNLLEVARVCGVNFAPWMLERLARHPNPLAGEKQSERGYILSRVHLLAESAGKVRAVAILDAFTQRILKPLHLDLFKVLERIPQDGTMSQNRLMSSLKKTFKEKRGYWSSIDISSATDSIPTILYRVLIEELYGQTKDACILSDNTIGLMTDRDFCVSVDPQIEKSDKDGVKNIPDTIRYGRGQPMGCLGSFALLGLWNNSWVQFASYMSTGRLLMDYGVTGDDVVIRDTDSQAKIGKKYLEHSGVFEIPISLSKSFASSNLFNFLSRTVMEGGEISPLSIKEDLAIENAMDRVERSFKLRERDYWSSLDCGWLSQAVKYFLYPSEYILHVKDVQKGILSGYGLRAILSYLVPSSSKIAALGLQGVSVFSWLAACAGSVSLLSHGDIVREDSPGRVYSDTERHKILESFASILLTEVIEMYSQNDRYRKQYDNWFAAQHAALREPGAGSLFIPSPWEFSHETSARNPFGSVDEVHIVPRPWDLGMALLVPVVYHTGVPIGDVGGNFVSPLGAGRRSEMDWRDPQFISESLVRIVDWMSAIPLCRNFLDADLFENSSKELLRSKRRNRFSELTRHENKIFSSLFQLALLAGGQINIDFAPDLVDHVERRLLKEYGLF